MISDLSRFELCPPPILRQRRMIWPPSQSVASPRTEPAADHPIPPNSPPFLSFFVVFPKLEAIPFQRFCHLHFPPEAPKSTLSFSIPQITFPVWSHIWFSLEPPGTVSCELFFFKGGCFTSRPNAKSVFIYFPSLCAPQSNETSPNIPSIPSVQVIFLTVPLGPYHAFPEPPSWLSLDEDINRLVPLRLFPSPI